MKTKKLKPIDENAVTDKQRKFLRKYCEMSYYQIKKLTKKSASEIIGNTIAGWKQAKEWLYSSHSFDDIDSDSYMMPGLNGL